MIKELFSDIANGLLSSATLSSPKDKVEGGVTKVVIRPLLIQGRMMYQLTEHYKQKVKHRNLGLDECAKYIEEALTQYKQGVFTTESWDYHVLVDKSGKATAVRRKSSKPLKVLPHNISKKYILPEGTPVPFLVHLGVMSVDGKVIAKKYNKFRQINRFLEMVRDIIVHLPKDKPLRIVDFGCGKAYLTFALQYYLHDIEKYDVEIIGLDLKSDVVAHCQELADKLGIKRLKFIVADIKDYELDGHIDLMISLHACDTATDAALEKSVRWNAKVILCVPCCQHELYDQVQSEALKPILQHGILRERFAALATDAARAELLAMNGYDVQLLEFIDMEHTPKNLLIRAVKSTKGAKSSDRYLKFKQALSIDPCLERLLNKIKC